MRSPDRLPASGVVRRGVCQKGCLIQVLFRRSVRRRSVSPDRLPASGAARRSVRRTGCLLQVLFVDVFAGEVLAGQATCFRCCSPKKCSPDWLPASGVVCWSVCRRGVRRLRSTSSKRFGLCAFGDKSSIFGVESQAFLD